MGGIRFLGFTSKCNDNHIVYMMWGLKEKRYDNIKLFLQNRPFNIICRKRQFVLQRERSVCESPLLVMQNALWERKLLEFPRKEK